MSDLAEVKYHATANHSHDHAVWTVKHPGKVSDNNLKRQETRSVHCNDESGESLYSGLV